MDDDGAWNAATMWGLNTIVDLRCSYEIGRHDDDPVLTTPPPVTRLAPHRGRSDPVLSTVPSAAEAKVSSS